MKEYIEKNTAKYPVPPNNMTAIRKPSCIHFSICGGCSFQHISQDIQINIKNSILKKKFKTYDINLHNQLAPLATNEWNYRYKARMSVKYDIKKDRVLIGFRERKNSRFVANIDSCKILPEHISNLFPELKKTVYLLSIKNRIPQIELTYNGSISILVFRILTELSENDVYILKNFSKENDIQIYLQPGNELSMYPLNKNNIQILSYTIEQYNVSLKFQPYHFIQVNLTLNKKMIEQAINLLECGEKDNILDLFCGIGNFSIPMATIVKSVTGIELSTNMVNQAKQNAKDNKLNNTNFIALDLQKANSLNRFKNIVNKVIIDPPRSGASTILSEVLSIKPKYILYISCNPDTLSSDAKIILDSTYYIEQYGIIDMFSQTKHIESMMLFKHDEYR